MSISSISVAKEPAFRRGAFVVACVATLLGFSMTTSQSFLPGVMETKGIPLAITGYAMASTSIFALVFGLLSAALMARLGTTVLMLAGMAIMCVCHLSFEITPKVFGGIFLSRMVYGIGAGIFYPAALTFVKGMLHGPRTVSLFAIYTAMIPGSNLLGAPVAEWYISNYGSERYFIFTAFPGVISVALFFLIWLQNYDRHQEFDLTANFSVIIRSPSSWLPLLCLFVAGSIWGYVISFLPYAAAAKDLPGSLFIVASTIGLFTSRFFVVNHIKKFNSSLVSGWAISSMAISLLVMALVRAPEAVAFCGVAFGISYALSYPFISIWILGEFDQKLHHIVISLTNALFNFCMFLAPLFVSLFASSTHLKIDSYQIILSIAGLVFIFIGYTWRYFNSFRKIRI
ncbi:MFS transporter [Rhizobium rhizogenes]|uniref:MFS transporter n=1 Tax=Rhizobium rhizogenes TaxID=359 RepID=UPI001572AFAF|nr:MFS transporter [Rhizobium rhizogenes]NTG11854.1 MFS transporter [Rhizobium rhizogenes]